MEKKTYTYYDYFRGKELTTELPLATKQEFLEERNKHYMNYIALSPENRDAITYEELHTRIFEFAKKLRKKGIKKGDRVALCETNTPEAVYLLYALDVIGAVVIGISTFNNEYKMKRDLEIAKPNWVISVDTLYGKLAPAAECLNITAWKYNEDLIVNTPMKKLSDEDKQIRVPYKEGSCSDVIFTGGSTGYHNGVMLDGNGLNCVVQALDGLFKLEPGMIHLGQIPICHMVFGRFSMHYALANNLNFAITKKTMPKDFVSEIKRTHANGAMGGPIHWQDFIENPLVEKNSISYLIQGLTGGEYIKPENLIKIIKKLRYGGSLLELFDSLGLTEMWAPAFMYLGKINTSGSLGYPIPYADAKIVNKDTLEPVQKGEPGTTLVSGPGLMLGYLDNEEATNKAFIYIDGKKWYNTGDMTKNMGINNEEYKFVGRVKRNFVCGVDNVYPEQVESLVLSIPEIKEIAVTKIPDQKYQYLPMYHIVLHHECDLNKLKEKIEILIESTLGASCLPGYIEYSYDLLPRNGNHKIDINTIQTNDLEKFKQQQQQLVLIKKEY